MLEDVPSFKVPNGAWERVPLCLHIHPSPPQQKIGRLCFQNPQLDLEDLRFWKESAEVSVDSALEGIMARCRQCHLAVPGIDLAAMWKEFFSSFPYR